MKVVYIAYGTGGSEIFEALRMAEEEESKTEYISISSYARNKIKESTYIKEEDIVEYIKGRANEIDIIVNERSNGLQVQNEVTKVCKEEGIYNICVLDFYGGYSQRFTEEPDYIIVPSKTIKNEMVDYGIKEENMRVCGNASFDRLQVQRTKKYNTNKPRVLYTSQGKERHYTLIDYDKELGSVFEEYKIEVKSHPQEDKEELEREIRGKENISIIEFDDRQDFIKELEKYDLVIGYNSTLQVQSYLMGIPTIFYELGGIKEALKKYKENKKRHQKHPYGDFEKNATEKTRECIKEKIKEKADKKVGK